MVRTLLIRGMLVGILAGLLAFVFAWLFGEPQVDLAIAFEDQMHQMAGDAPDAEIVSRGVQSTIGLFTGVVTYSCALGGIFALVFAYAYGRIGRFSPRATALLIAAAGLVVLILAPQIKYPANPPSIGNPETIGARTALYFGMIAFSVVAAVLALNIGRGVAGRIGVWNAAILGGVVYVVVIAAAMLALPAINEVPSAFSAVTLWRFRLASFGINVVVWTTLGLAFGALTERHVTVDGRFADRPRLARSA
jgi:hypothetical protein